MDNNNYSTAILYTKKNTEHLMVVKNACKNTNFNLIYETDFYNFIKKVIRTHSSLLIIDGYSRRLSKFPFNLLDNEVFHKKTIVVVLSDNFICENKYIKVLRVEDFENFLYNFENKYESNNSFHIANCEKKINAFLLNMGFSAKLKGKDYLKSCLKLILEDNVKYNCLNKECYPVVASQFNTNLVNIDRNIRNAIKQAYLTRVDNVWENIFNCHFNEVPSSREFIYLCVDKIKEMG